ncbi:SDR family oxidoreductase [Paenibacillus pasadenensis]|uniref:SDR family oxidoreductase n=1 Tax=Paenibacillus pasadenensis TaxID=217090 RepID=UPI00203B4184|nr:SDR family oxidoreductase [Paenibacillus pasadenensis]MCM3747193.1 SDR family oxidoreductase [Paenibacillus pasadenensis]
MTKGFVAITGASSGIGEATANYFLEKGHNVLLLARRIERLEKFQGEQVRIAKVDVTDEAALKSAIQQAADKFGPIQAMINNAGVMLLGDVANQSSDEWKTMFDVNVLGLLKGMQAVLPSMIERKTGTIINVSSIAGKKTFTDHAAYVGTKFAVHSMSENVREEVAKHNVRVITIAPGVVETELLGHTTSDEIKSGYNEWKNSIQGGLSPQTVAETIYFAFSQPQNVNIREIVLAPTMQVG